MRVRYSTTLDDDLLEKLKIRAIKEKKRINVLLEEAIKGLLNLQTSALELQNDNDQLRERIRNLEKENEALKKKIAIKESLIIEHGVYFSKTSEGKDGPFCPRCWKVENNLVKLMILSDHSVNCPNCPTHYKYQSVQNINKQGNGYGDPADTIPNNYD